MTTPETPAEAIADHFRLGPPGISQMHIDQGQKVIDTLTDAGFAVVRLPAHDAPSPALIEAAYVAQDDLSTPPAQWLIESTAEIITAYIDGQGHKTVHVIGHPEEDQ